ncbi:type I-E CRISPR-associated protein Cas7/Cse4/CasC [Streptomyces sp. McG5]|uniref:type I-E CRISPR-associated protein Cas7/Cse4/CasC n=1 Tax=unclassified Streptomyces TaxID=2593676 RepID=UPI001BEC132D|nr:MULTISPECIES: type I-E CRISPR-associated protein Cas7/Cse4/CasC [unclassified Streptomyces]MBT2880194.1 type I-E CRISPR-associated protein Cas7/Cse4/CasC [Streptomyces sp. McG6]MBT2887478.1 type I-E CRISPR-associated protein Cas7/Cse4/CasC [Streptomyces sp. McG5]MBT2893313.1 type I-E CRISPR-associated protein Cas7/Cse4/CasC [Streptomyces sp. McG2]
MSQPAARPPRTYVDFHILQTVPPANLNRDDQGNPKEAYYGGVRRSRVSSQAWKRATRTHFAERVPEQDLATRTRRIIGALADDIQKRAGLDRPAALRLADALLAPLELSGGKKKDESAYLLFYGRRQLDAVAALVADQATELSALSDADLASRVKELPVREQFSTGHPIDVALFGRMVADIPALKVDAAAQVAHALSTHAVELEFDYFTAVDDEQTDEETGAGMIGTIGFNSATLYRYASVGLHQLLDNLTDEEAALTAISEFATSFARSMPTGYQNSFAHRTLPSLVAVVVREDQPVNLVSAFEQPVATPSGIAAASAIRLAEEHTRATVTWGDAPAFAAATHVFTDHQKTTAVLNSAFGPSIPFSALLEGLHTHLAGALKPKQAAQ